MANTCVKIPFISIAAEQANLFSVDNVSSGNLVLQHESLGFLCFFVILPLLPLLW